MEPSVARTAQVVLSYSLGPMREQCVDHMGCTLGLRPMHFKLHRTAPSHH